MAGGAAQAVKMQAIARRAPGKASSEGRKVVVRGTTTKACADKAKLERNGYMKKTDSSAYLEHA